MAKSPKPEFSPLEKRVIYELQGDLEVQKTPFARLAERLGIKEAELLSLVREFVAKGMIRRFGATLYHQRSGFQANVMVVWRVEETKADEVGGVMASFKEVTHCYLRPSFPNWPYNLYTMIHAKDEPSSIKVVEKIAEKTGIREYSLLFSLRELKKTTMRYFHEEFDQP